MKVSWPYQSLCDLVSRTTIRVDLLVIEQESDSLGGRMAQLSILTLGSLQIALNGASLTNFDSDKARGLLTYLAIESHRAHRRESLIGLFWPEYLERRARHTLSQVLFNVRQVIGDRKANQETTFLHVTHQTLQFNRSSNHWLDVNHLDIALSSDATTRLAQLEQRAALYRGQFLEGFSLGDSPAFEEWALMRREWVQRIALETLGRLVAGYARQNLYDKALHYAWRQLDLDPWREEAHRQVMRLLALSGQRTAALAQYETCRQTLREELNVEPEAETIALYDTIKTGNLAPSPTRLLPHASISTPTHNLPAQLTPLVGRAVELTDLRACLRGPTCRLITLVGPGGIGKTRLALEAVRPLVLDFDHGVFFVPLAPLQSPQAIVPAIAHTLGFTFSDKGGPQERQLLAYLRNKQRLLILDNAEHLIAPPPAASDGQETHTGERDLGISATVTRLLEAAPGVKILVTSRTRLSVLGEHIFPVRELAYPEQSHVRTEILQNMASVRLFIQSARRVRPDFALTERNIEAVSAICRCVQGSPLAILLAATWTATLSTTDIAAQLTSETADLDLLRTDWRNVPARHRSLRAVFEHSWRLLTDHQQVVMQALSVFRGGFTPDAALAVADATPHDLRQLVNVSFLRRESSGRYTVHELLRQFVAEKLELEEAAYIKTNEEHCTFYIAALRVWGEDLGSPRQLDTLAEMAIEINNARAAWHWTVAHRQITRLRQAMPGLRDFYFKQHRYQEAKAMCYAVVERLNALDKLKHLDTTLKPSIDDDEMRLIFSVLAWYRMYLAPEEAEHLLNELLAQLSQSGLQDTRPEEADILAPLWLYAPVNDEKVKQQYERSLALYQQLGNQSKAAYVLNSLGWVATHSANYAEAEQRFEQSLAISRDLGELWGMAHSLRGLSAALMRLGQTERSLSLLQQSLEIRRKIDHPGDIADGISSLGSRYFVLGKSEQAQTTLEQALALYNELGAFIGLTEQVLTATKIQLGQYQTAHKRAQTHLIQIRQSKDRLATCVCLYVLGWAEIALQDYVNAQRNLRESITICQTINERGELGQAYALMGYAMRGSGNLIQARQHFYNALHISAETGALYPLILGFPGIAGLMLDQDDLERAVELYAMAERFPFVINSCWFADVVGQAIAEAAASLAPEIIAAAQARGRARDMQATVKELLAELGD